MAESVSEFHYTQFYANRTFDSVIAFGSDILFRGQAHGDYRKVPFYFNITVKSMIEEKRFDYYAHFLPEDYYNYRVAERLINQAISEIMDAHAIMLAMGEGMGGDWGQSIPAVAWSIYVDKINEIQANYIHLANSIKSHSNGTGAGGTLIWEVPPEEPEPGPQPSPQGDPGNASPIILDMDNDGIETVGVAEGTHFDLDGNRFAEKSGWVGADDALLIRDRNANGQIDNGGELFGNHTLLANENKAANGFVALAELDINRDGIVDIRDGEAVRTQLKLWQDKNGNGVLDAGEMMSMEEAGVAGLNVGYKNQSHTDENGNDHKQVGSFIRDDGSKGTMADVWFKTDLTDTRFMDEIEVNADVAELPNLRGYGNIPSLHQAMALDTSGRLQALMEQYLGADSATARFMTWDIIFAWTGVTNIDPRSRGNNIADARKLYAMEVIWGKKFPSFYGNTPGSKEGVSLEAAFVDWEAKVASYFLLSTHYNGLYKLAVEAVTSVEAGQAETGAVTGLVAALREMYSDNRDNGHTKVLDFLSALRSYDTRGIACSAVIESLYAHVQAGDSFEQWVSAFFKERLDGTADADRLYAHNNDKGTLILGRGGDDYLYGSSYNDLLDAGSGNDTLVNSTGNDVFIFSRGYGHDTIESYSRAVAADRDVVRLVGLTIEDVEFLYGKSSADLLIRIKDTGETLTVISALATVFGPVNRYGIQAIEFGDGRVMEWAEFEAAGLLRYEGTTGDDYFMAGHLGSIMEGRDGADKLYGSIAADVLRGSAGADYLDGLSGDDIYDGGADNDRLVNSAGNDTFVFSRGYGNDTIEGLDRTGNDTLRFIDANPAELWFGQSGNHLTIGLIGMDDKVTVNNWFSGTNYQIDSIEAGGLAITESQVALMIQAMAAIGASGGADGQWTDEQRDALTPVLATYWQPRG